MRSRRVAANLLGRLKKIEGQIVGLSRMVNESRYCVDILHQIRAAEAGLHRVGEILLNNHLQTCVTDAFEAGDAKNRQEKIDELVGIYQGMRPK